MKHSSCAFHGVKCLWWRNRQKCSKNSLEMTSPLKLLTWRYFLFKECSSDLEILWPFRRFFTFAQGISRLFREPTVRLLHHFRAPHLAALLKGSSKSFFVFARLIPNAERFFEQFTVLLKLHHFREPIFRSSHALKFFREPKVLLLWHRFKEPNKALLFIGYSHLHLSFHALKGSSGTPIYCNSFTSLGIFMQRFFRRFFRKPDVLLLWHCFRKPHLAPLFVTNLEIFDFGG